MRSSPEGAAVFDWLMNQPEMALAESPPDLPLGGYREAVRRVRLGQRGFQAVLCSVYRGRCAIIGESTAIALEAAHIVPFAVEQRHEVRNGLLLRADPHRLFDAGLIGLEPSDLTIKVSREIETLYSNGRLYRSFQGRPLKVLPEQPQHQPDPAKLEWRLAPVFRG